MPAVVAWIGSMLLTLAGSWLLQLLVSAGIAVVTFTGVQASLGWLKTQALSSAFALGPQIVGLLSVLKVGQCISIIFSAMLAKLALAGFSSDKFKKFIKK
jgi:Protein of unknown function (DUF2523)